MLNERFDLPFDLFTRNKIISDLIDRLRKNKKWLKILDIGGRSGYLKQFLQEDDDLYILDILKSESNEKSYFVGDIIYAPFKDAVFDVVVSSDLFEHIHPENRENSLSEMLRISKNFVILGAPFYSEDVTDAEIKANEFFRKLTGNDHLWLSEHIKNGLPSKEKVEDFFENNGFDYLTIKTNNISNWILMQAFIFYSYKYGIPNENVSKIYRFYNDNFLELGDSLSPTYRTIYLCGRKGTLPEIDFKFDSKMNLSKYHTLKTLIFETIGQFTSSKDIHIHNLETIIQDKDTRMQILETAVQKKDDYIEGMKTTVKNKDDYIEGLKTTVKNKDEHIQNLDSLIAENNRKLNDIYNRTTWQILTKYQRLVDIILPHTTRRRCLYDRAIIGFRIIANEGLGTFLFKIKERIRGSTLNTSKIPIVETSIVSPCVPLSLVNSLSGKFTFPSDNLNEIRIRTATYQRQNSDLILYITNVDGQILRKTTVKGHRIQDNGYTFFSFKPIKDSKEKTFFFKLMSKKEPSAAVWYNESITSSELTLFYNDKLIKGGISFEAFANIGIKSRYDFWILKNEPTATKLEQYKTEIKNFEYKPTISIVTPVYNPDVAWIRAAIESVRNQVYEHWELCLADASTKKDVRICIETYVKKDPRIKVKFLSENRGISGNSNEALSLATGEYIGLLDHDDEITPDALYEVVKYLQNNRDADMIYSDEDKVDLKGNRKGPFFKPDWSLDMFLSCMFTCHFGVYNKKIIDEIGGFREGYDGSQDYDLVLRIMDKTNSIHHIPKILYHWRTVHGSVASAAGAKSYAYVAAKKALAGYMKRNNIDGEVLDGFWTGSYYVKRKLFKTPLVSVIIPTKDNVDILKRCIDSIFQKTSYSNYEIIIVDNNSTNKKTFDYFEKLKIVNNIKILEYKKDFNFSEINNFAVQNAKGEVILFLNNDTEIITNGWITAMLEHAQRSEVGAVGCKLLYPNKTIQHAGVILGITGTPGEKGVAGHSHKHLPTNSNGYIGRVNIIHNVSAVTAACMMLRKDVFEDVGGFDDNLAVAFNDVDLCLKIREKGYLIVYTPYAELCHHESLSRGYENTPEKQERFSKEVKYIRDKWGAVIDEGDPYYNPNLTLEREDFEIKI